jgi:hypothetical protein
VPIIPVKPIAKALGKDVDETVEKAAKPMPDLLPDPVIPEADLAAMRAADARDASVQDKIPEEEITVFHGTPSEFPAVSEVVSLKTGERVLVDKKQYPDWTQHPDLEPADYEFVADHELGAFDSSKIGTGEGAQAFGHGLYFAERRGTAESYQKGLAKGVSVDGAKPYKTHKRHVQDYAANYVDGKLVVDKFSADEIIADTSRELRTSGEKVRETVLSRIDSRIRQYTTDDPIERELHTVLGEFETAEDALTGLKGLRQNVADADLSRFSFKEGTLYEVKIKARQEEFLDLDDVIGEQDQPFVEKIFESNPQLKGLIDDAYDYYTPGGENATGFSVLRTLQETFEPQEYADILNKAGIKGFKYKDAQTRFSKKGATYNYVVFDDKIIDIAKKYGVSLFAAGSVSLGLMTPQQAQAQENPIGAPKPQPGTPEATADDTATDFLLSREGADLTPAQKAIQQANAMRQQGMTIAAPTPTPAPERTTGEKAVAVAKDIGEGIIETPRAILGGFLKATQEAGEALESVFGQLPTAGKDYEPISIDDPESTTGQLVQGVSQFLTGFLPAMKGAKAVGLAKSAPYAAGFVADALVFDPQEARLSDLVQEYPALQNPVTEYLASDPNDSRAEGMFKNGLEGLGLGGLTDALFKVVKVVKGNKNVKAQAEAAGETVEEFVGPKLPEFVGPDAPPIKENQSLVPTGRVEVEEPEFIPFDEIADEASVEVPSPVKGGKGAAPDEAAKNINLNRLETTDEVKELLDAAAEADPISVNNARRQEITQKETEALANDLGMTVDDLLARKGGEAFNAEQAVAARRLLVASGENLIKVAKAAKDGGQEALLVFRRAMAQHRAIQLEVAGMTAEAGRALQSFRIMASSAAEQEKMIKEAIEASGGMDMNQNMAAKMAGIKDVGDVGSVVKNFHQATVMDMISEFWLNGLLSGLGTHAMNITSNLSVIGLSVIERQVAGTFGKSVARGEAGAQILGIVEGAKEGLKLAGKALRTGESTDIMQKQEVAMKKSITGEQLNLSGTLGQAVNFIGNVIRTPGRALMASDEFFKAVAYRMELQARAYRTAVDEGLEGDEFVQRVNGILTNPPADIKMDAVNFGRYQTFTNALSETPYGEPTKRQPGKFITKLRDDSGILGVVAAPFLRTPINVVKYASARGPLAPFMPSVKADIQAGGARKELALARIATGSAMMSITGLMAIKGQITGQGPANYNERRIKEATGWKPNSLLVGDTYYSLERADPIAQILLMSANIYEVVGQAEDDNTFFDLISAGAFTIANSLTSKTFYNGLSELLSAYDSASRDPDNQQNAVVKYVERLAASTVPAIVAAEARRQDPTLRAANTLVEQFKRRLPGYSKDLPPRRNMFGEPIVLEGGLGPDFMSPFYQSGKKYNDVATQMSMNEMATAMPGRTIDGVELTTIQQDRYIMLSAGLDEYSEPLPGGSLHQRLSQLIKTPQYKRATVGRDGMQAQMITTVINDYRLRARKMMPQEFPELQSKIRALDVEDYKAKQGVIIPTEQQRQMGILSGDLIP